ncbi:fungal specific transcription factor domain-containing protein [Aspergillus foveolatus]|uniref:fungal specific transcription factor domain-containing protein n=1 Tax=Aspergillus foveolatus TaxID=210207 RepID=UPI003CCDACA7
MYTDSAPQCGFDEDRATRSTGALSCVYNQAIARDVLGMELLLASATRFTYHLRGNIHPAKADVRPPRLGDHIRNLFWLCYVFNQDTTMRTGLPSAINDSSCDPTLPDHSEFPDLPPTVPGHGYGPDRRGAPLRPADTGSMASSVLQLQYHYCMAAIHQASGLCKSWTDSQDTRAQGSCLAISVAASRSLLYKFAELELYFHHYNLLFYLPYLTAAIIHLFCNILLYPCEESSQSDLELIAACRSAWGRNYGLNAPAAFRMQVKYVKDVCGEIERLAHIAISSSNE